MYYLGRFTFLGFFILSCMWVSGWSHQSPQRGYASYEAPAQQAQWKYYYDASYKY